MEYLLRPCVRVYADNRAWISALRVVRLVALPLPLHVLHARLKHPFDLFKARW